MLSNYFKFISSVVVTSVFCINATYANGGIALGATRLIYEQDKKQASMPVINSTTNKRFLINTWIEDASSKKIKSVIVTPPMFVSEAKSESSLRIINTNQTLARDRETLYYLNVQAIPSVSKEELEKQNVLQLAILSRIKMMIRPENLSIRIEDAPSLLEVSIQKNKVVMKNPTPYFMTVANLTVDTQPQTTFMLDPFSEKPLDHFGHNITFQTINDYGAFTQERKINIQ
ncbi:MULTISPECIES: fimbria/pilus periplasmic chaperone [Acinetobacter]|uniref:fimbria/pilus periplasmic chaperone n=1 Tax=Acinetobacter TaxID=469 RepID=UPI00141B909C|nr:MULTISPECIES: fimbria/pilus periplasmic chaperone [Acinetobacter]MCS4299142.1 P pilus assembly chaperone PapD [Acinetobacter guillouiae]MCW2250211.1 P pilus assembly chaperone PapD [Acinetobacter sp. BIGb0204]NII39314.1 P pilus assembly chaperone PapD [Acinetobacter sp. BIGb0196]